MDHSPVGLQTCHVKRCNQARLTESAVNLATVSRIFDPMRVHTGVTKPRLIGKPIGLAQSEKRRGGNLHPDAGGATDNR